MFPVRQVASGPEVLFVETELSGENRKKGTESSGFQLEHNL